MLAGIIYGSWAAYSNSDHGIHAAKLAGLGQGLYALFSTYIVTLTTYYCFHKTKQNSLIKQSLTCRLTLSFFISFLVMLSIPIIIHSLLLTPDILEAITPGLIWGSGYVMFLLWKEEKATQID